MLNFFSVKKGNSSYFLQMFYFLANNVNSTEKLCKKKPLPICNLIIEISINAPTFYLYVNIFFIIRKAKGCFCMDLQKKVLILSMLYIFSYYKNCTKFVAIPKMFRMIGSWYMHNIFECLWQRKKSIDRKEIPKIKNKYCRKLREIYPNPI